MPVVEGRRPVMNEARDGLQSGAEACAFWNVTPRFARRSRFGVIVCGCPFIGPIQLFRSSAMMSRTFGFSLGAPNVATAHINKRTRTRAQFFMLVFEKRP